MKSKHFWAGFLSAFDPFKPAPKREPASKASRQFDIEGEFRVVPEAETLMHNAFVKALSDVKQAS